MCACAEDFATKLNSAENSVSDDEFSSEAALYGTIKDNYGEPVEGVLVSDGIQTTVTDGSGNYELFSELPLRRFVQITVPAGYEISSTKGIPQFWQRIPEDAEKFKADFTLMRRTIAGDCYTVLMTADPQIRAKTEKTDNYMFHSIDMYEDMCTDMKELAASITDRPVYSICLGDMVHNNMNLWETYCSGIGDFDFPVFHVIGNHDHIQNVKTDDLAVAYYEKYLGPTNYAVDLGQLHYIFLDNIYMADNSNLSGGSTGDYRNGLSDEALEWLRGHLSHVDKSKILMMCAHSSLYKKLGRDPSESDKNASAYTELLSGYKFIHSWAGHNHDYFNYAYAAEEANSKYSNVESHILGRSTGMLGLNAGVTADGVPRGYLVIDVAGENITWKFKPCGYEENRKSEIPADWQFRAYYPYENDYYTTGKVYANVWNYDGHWGPVYYSDSGKNKVEMNPDKTHDGYANYLYEQYKSQYSTMSYTVTPHMFSIEPTAEAKSAIIETTDRFGNRYSKTVTW